MCWNCVVGDVTRTGECVISWLFYFSVFVVISHPLLRYAACCEISRSDIMRDITTVSTKNRKSLMLFVIWFSFIARFCVAFSPLCLLLFKLSLDWHYFECIFIQQIWILIEQILSKEYNFYNNPTSCFQYVRLSLRRRL